MKSKKQIGEIIDAFEKIVNNSLENIDKKYKNINNNKDIIEVLEKLNKIIVLKHILSDIRTRILVGKYKDKIKKEILEGKVNIQNILNSMYNIQPGMLDNLKKSKIFEEYTDIILKISNSIFNNEKIKLEETINDEKLKKLTWISRKYNCLLLKKLCKWKINEYKELHKIFKEGIEITDTEKRAILSTIGKHEQYILEVENKIEIKLLKVLDILTKIEELESKKIFVTFKEKEIEEIKRVLNTLQKSIESIDKLLKNIYSELEKEYKEYLKNLSKTEDNIKKNQKIEEIIKLYKKIIENIEEKVLKDKLNINSFEKIEDSIKFEAILKLVRKIVEENVKIKNKEEKKVYEDFLRKILKEEKVLKRILNQDSVEDFLNTLRDKKRLKEELNSIRKKEEKYKEENIKRIPYYQYLLKRNSYEIYLIINTTIETLNEIKNDVTEENAKIKLNFIKDDKFRVFNKLENLIIINSAVKIWREIIRSKDKKESIKLLIKTIEGIVNTNLRNKNLPIIQALQEVWEILKFSWDNIIKDVLLLSLPKENIKEYFVDCVKYEKGNVLIEFVIFKTTLDFMKLLTYELNKLYSKVSIKNKYVEFKKLDTKIINPVEEIDKLNINSKNNEEIKVNYCIHSKNKKGIKDIRELFNEKDTSESKIRLTMSISSIYPIILCEEIKVLEEIEKEFKNTLEKFTKEITREILNYIISITLTEFGNSLEKEGIVDKDILKNLIKNYKDKIESKKIKEYEKIKEAFGKVFHYYKSNKKIEIQKNYENILKKLKICEIKIESIKRKNEYKIIKFEEKTLSKITH